MEFDSSLDLDQIDGKRVDGFLSFVSGSCSQSDDERTLFSAYESGKVILTGVHGDVYNYIPDLCYLLNIDQNSGYTLEHRKTVATIDLPHTITEYALRRNGVSFKEKDGSFVVFFAALCASVYLSRKTATIMMDPHESLTEEQVFGIIRDDLNLWLSR